MHSSIRHGMNVLLFLIIAWAKISINAAKESCTTIPKTGKNVPGFAIANNYFTFTLYKQLISQSSENIFYSPFSLFSDFAMVYLGSRGGTSRELKKALGYKKGNLNRASVHMTFRDVLASFNQRDDETVLKTANAIITDLKFKLKPCYERTLKNSFQANVLKGDYTTEEDRIVSEINEWIKNNTEGKIEKVLESMTGLTSMVLLSAVYFKGVWNTPFPKQQTNLAPFYNNGNDEKRVPMMHVKESFNFHEEADFKIVELPYAGNRISMFVMLPSERDGLPTLEKNFSSQRFDEIRKLMRKVDVMVSLPKFMIKYSKEMQSTIRALGVQQLFSPSADLSRMTNSESVFVSEVFHKTFIDVNEEGTEAAGFTRMLFLRSMGKSVTANRPFMFIILDKMYDIILFLGRVNEL